MVFINDNYVTNKIGKSDSKVIKAKFIVKKNQNLTIF